MTVYEVSWLERLCVTRQPRDQERTATRECYCCRPQYIGKSILLCGKKQSFFPQQCLVGPDWPCMICTYSLITIPTILWMIWVAKPISNWLVVLGIVTWCCVITAFSFTACSDPGIVFSPMIEDDLGKVEDGLNEQTDLNSSVSSSDKVSINGDNTNSSGISKTNAGGGENTTNSTTSGRRIQGTSSTESSTISSNNPYMVNRNPPVMSECSQCEIYRPVGAMHCYDCQVCVEGLDHHCPWTGKCIGKKNLTTFYCFLFTLTVHIIVVGMFFLSAY